MYYRRKILLALLEANNGKLNKTRLQKLLLLVTRKQEKKTYDFVPYQYGCYSFTANQDLSTLTKYGLVEESTSGQSSVWKKTDSESYLSQLKKEDRTYVNTISKQFSKMSNDELITYTYKNYPFWAINSTIAERLLNKDDLQRINKQKSTQKDKVLYTIGYEGISLETYINRLIINNIRVLCDVRKNSLSMKYGFSKSQLKHACEGVGIEYRHIPELGIESDKRQQLNSLADYNALFRVYVKTTLKENESYVHDLIDLINNKNRVAITCFEKEHCMCHRGKVAEKVSKLDSNIPVKHI